MVGVSEVQQTLRPGMRLHFVGIGGTGMSGLAALMLARGYAVSGCDIAASSTTDDLARRGATITFGHDPSHVGDTDLLVISSAIPPANPDVVEARRRGVPVIKRAELLGELTRQHRTIAVAGTHGKTTTTALVALGLSAAGLDPSAVVGGVVPAFGSGSRIGRGPHLVVEADEFDGSFLRFSPRIAVVTNVEADHLDYYQDLAAIENAFAQFCQLLPSDGQLILCADYPSGARLAGVGKAPVWTYGIHAEADWRAREIAPNEVGGNDFVTLFRGEVFGRYRLRIPGRHNVQNALGAIAAAHAVGADARLVAQAFEEFTGVRRRFELKGEVRGISVYDDYAHHPRKVMATLAAARERRPKRIVCVFQPHTYHRTKSLFAEFARAFTEADRVIVTDIYAPTGRDVPLSDVSAASLVQAMRHPGAEHIASLDDVVERLSAELRSGDLVLTMGAGDVTRVSDALVRRLQANVTTKEQS